MSLIVAIVLLLYRTPTPIVTSFRMITSCRHFGDISSRDESNRPLPRLSRSKSTSTIVQSHLRSKFPPRVFKEDNPLRGCQSVCLSVCHSALDEFGRQCSVGRRAQSRKVKNWKFEVGSRKKRETAGLTRRVIRNGSV